MSKLSDAIRTLAADEPDSTPARRTRTTKPGTAKVIPGTVVPPPTVPTPPGGSGAKPKRKASVPVLTMPVPPATLPVGSTAAPPPAPPVPTTIPTPATPPATPPGGTTIMSMSADDLANAIVAGFTGVEAAKKAAAKAEAKAVAAFRTKKTRELTDAGITGDPLTNAVNVLVRKKFPDFEESTAPAAPAAPGTPTLPGTPPVTSTATVYHTTTNGTFRWWPDGEHVVVQQVSTGASHPFLRTDWDAALKRQGNIEVLASKAIASGVLPKPGVLPNLKGRFGGLSFK